MASNNRMNGKKKYMLLTLPYLFRIHSRPQKFGIKACCCVYFTLNFTQNMTLLLDSKL